MKYFIGDIHGEYEKLTRLISVLERDAAEYVFLGDYLDKGLKVRETVDFLLELAKTKKCVFLMGDHEYAWKRYFEGEERFYDFLLKYGGPQTIWSYLGKMVSGEETKKLLADKKTMKDILRVHEGFFTGLEPYHEVNGEFLAVHAGIKPEKKDLALADQDTEELVFVRNDFINSKFLYKGKKIVFGHTAFPEPYRDDFKVGIDTGAVYPEMGNLTAFNAEEKFFVQEKRGRFA